MLVRDTRQLKGAVQRITSEPREADGRVMGVPILDASGSVEGVHLGSSGYVTAPAFFVDVVFISKVTSVGKDVGDDQPLRTLATSSPPAAG